MINPNYNIYFDVNNFKGAIKCINEYGYCVIRKMIGEELVKELKCSIDEFIDPGLNIPPASNRSHLAFAEVSRPLWKLIENAPYLNFNYQVYGTKDLCLHRSAAILRTAGESFGTWHTDSREHIKTPKVASDLLNCHGLLSGAWFYLNGSHPDHSGIAVIEKSHYLDWDGPERFELTQTPNSFHPIGDDVEATYKSINVPGCVPVVAEPGDLICFADRTFHTNMATYERRFSCGIGLRPKSIKINAPWSLPLTAQRMIENLPRHLKPYVDGYTGYDGQWEADQ